MKEKLADGLDRAVDSLCIGLVVVFMVVMDWLDWDDQWEGEE